jgi:CHAT domain-containing protein
MVYLSCCQSAASGDSTVRAFSDSLGMADRVLRSGVPVVIAHRWPVVDDDKHVNAVAEFYQRLSRGYPPEYALFSARNAVDKAHPSWASAVMILQR